MAIWELKCRKHIHRKVCFGSIECCIIKECIAIIFSTPKCEYMGLHITHYSRDEHYIVHTKYGDVQLNRYKMGLP